MNDLTLETVISQMLEAYIRCVFCVTLLSASSWSHQIDAGPDNVLVITSHEATLSCNRSSHVEVQWKFRPLGNDQERDIAGPYRIVTTSYGLHSLVVENVQLSHAGTYVCRSVGTHVLSPAGAYLVVMAQKPCCHVDAATVTCSVAYAGLMNVTLSLVADDNGVVYSRNFAAQQVVSTHAVSRSGVELQTQYRCRVSFFSTHSHVDVANNQPGYVEEMCNLLLTRVLATESSQRVNATNRANGLSDAIVNDDDRGHHIAIILSIVSLLVVVVVSVACRCFQSTARRHQRTLERRRVDMEATNHCVLDNRSNHAQVSADDTTEEDSSLAGVTRHQQCTCVAERADQLHSTMATD